MDDAILVWLLLNSLYMFCTIFDRWYIILFSRLDYEVIGTTGIIIQEMNVVIIIMDDAILASLFAIVYTFMLFD